MPSSSTSSQPGTTSNAGSSNSTKFYQKGSGLTPSQNQKAAETLKELIEQHPYVVEIEMPGDVHCNPTMQLEINGTDSAFDTTYSIKSITHRFSIHNGYTMEILASAPAGGAGAGVGGAPTSADAVPNPSAANSAVGPDDGEQGFGGGDTTTTQASSPTPVQVPTVAPFQGGDTGAGIGALP